jgi:hypothetical protein
VERFSKVAVTLWTCAAVVLQAWLLRSWSDLPWLTPLVGVLAMALAWFDRRSVGIVLAFAYVFYVVIYYVHGIHYAGFGVLWLAALLGTIMPDALRTHWHLPRLWRAGLVFAALIVVISTTLSIWRETQGAPMLLLELGPPMWEGAVQPSFPVRWILNVALILVIGILWFDWLLGQPDLDFDRFVAAPLLIGVVAMSSVSIYQMLVNVRFLNPTLYGGIGRASGTMFDGNVAGTLAALWIGGVVFWARRGGRARWLLAVVVIAINVLAVWASGSRTAAVAATFIIAIGSLSFARVQGRIAWLRVSMGAGLVAAIVAATLVVGSRDQYGLNPASRIWDMIVKYPDPIAFVTQLWQRNEYGSLASYFIRQAPVAGIGVGSFHAFVAEEAMSRGMIVPPDNAQNWLRHQIAEFGFLGAAGWIVWFLAFGLTVLTARRGQPATAWILRGMLVAFATISLVGMPGQEAATAITFWTFAAWYVRVIGYRTEWRPLATTVWAACAAGVVVFTAATAWTFTTDWSVANRSAKYNRPFVYGVSRPIPSGPDAGYRRLSSSGRALVTPHSRWLVVRAKRAPEARDGGPVDVLVSSEGRTVLKARLDSAAVVEGFVPVKAGDRHMLFEMSARPTGPLARFRPFAGDSGVLVTWAFVEYVSGDVKQYSALRGVEPR